MCFQELDDEVSVKRADLQEGCDVVVVLPCLLLKIVWVEDPFRIVFAVESRLRLQKQQDLRTGDIEFGVLEACRNLVLEH